MFFSKIWLFLLTLIAGAAITVALLLPRPAERAHVLGEQQRLAVGCGVVNILLADNARRRVDFARRFARAPELGKVLYEASAADQLDERRMASAREIGNRLISSAKGDAPDFAMLIDTRGRVVARAKRDEKDFGDLVAGRPLVDDALAGLVRDDLWVIDNTLYLVAGAPVMGREPLEYLGAVVLGHRVTTELTRSFTEWSRGDGKSQRFHVELAVYLGADLMASTTPVAIDTAPMIRAVSGLSDRDVIRDCQLNQPLNLKAGKEEYSAVVARMPGEAQSRQAYFTVFIQRPTELGVVASTMAIRKSDLSPSSFPWPLLSAGVVVALLLGIGLMVLEADRPLRRLAREASKLATGEIDRFAEDRHSGRFGSVARNVNIQIDRVARVAKSAKQDLDQLLGPAPQGSLGTIDLLAAGPSSSGSMPASPPPPPSEFRFSHTAKPAAALDLGLPLDLSRPPEPRGPVARPRPPAPAIPETPFAPAMPPPLGKPRVLTPPPMPIQAQPLRFDDDILGAVSQSTSSAASPPAETVAAPAGFFDSATDATFRDVYSQFVAAKQACGESISGITFDKFAEKLRRNRDELMSRTGCRDVQFRVYVKDGKAALKATPVRD
jgi:hypothetical protein